MRRPLATAPPPRAGALTHADLDEFFIRRANAHAARVCASPGVLTYQRERRTNRVCVYRPFTNAFQLPLQSRRGCPRGFAVNRIEANRDGCTEHSKKSRVAASNGTESDTSRPLLGGSRLGRPRNIGKWFVAYTEIRPRAPQTDGFWIAKGEWGFAGYVRARRSDLPRSRHIDQTRRPTTNRLRQPSAVGDLDRHHRVREPSWSSTSFGVIELPTHDRLQTVIRERRLPCRQLDGRNKGPGSV